MPINQQSRIWEGVYASFADIPYERDVFEEATWLEKQVRRAQGALDQVRSGQAPTGIFIDHTLAIVAATMARGDRPLRILDFGGGLGTSYLSLKPALRPEQPLEFVVVENAALCDIGRSMFGADPAIHFSPAIPAGQSFDIVHAGSSIHYVDDWRDAIKRFAQTEADYVLFADLPAGDIETFVTAQWFHGRQIPVRFWNLDEFSSCVAGFGYELIFRAPFLGAYLERNASLPTSHFDTRHRLDRFCQLVFRRNPESRIPDPESRT